MLDPELIALSCQRPLRRVEYDRMVSLGFFENERIELLYGALVQMTPIDPAHQSCVDRLTELFVLALHGRARVRVQGAFAASEFSEPEPDVSILPPGDYRTEHPGTAWLLIEVANSSLSKDRKVKAKLYAECEVPEYWIVDLVGQAVERFTVPVEGVYTARATFRAGDSISPLRFPDLSVELTQIL